MSTLAEQIELEESLYQGGIVRAEKMMTRTEEKGMAAINPYAAGIYREFVLAISLAIKEDIAKAATGKAGKNMRYIAAIRDMNTDSVSLIAVRTVLNQAMRGSDSHRELMNTLGSEIHRELVLTEFANIHPEAFYALTHLMSKRLSINQRHRLKLYMKDAKDQGIKLTPWDNPTLLQVGAYLSTKLTEAGLIVVSAPIITSKGGKISKHRLFNLSDQLLNYIHDIRDYVKVASPLSGPCVIPPRDWSNQDGRPQGGWHSKSMVRNSGQLVVMKHRKPYIHVVPDTVLESINTLQHTVWRVNKPLLEAVKKVAATFSTDEIVSLNDRPAPDKPSWLTKEDVDTDALSPERADEFIAWKRKMRDWYTARKLLGEKYYKMATTIGIATRMAQYPSLYFVYFLDSRGRIYPRTTGINPQGTDLQKSMLEFSEGLPLDTPDAIRWFQIHGSNKWGFDKASLVERQAWVVEHSDLIVSFADDPVNNPGWVDADKPLQFLAWCFEYAAWQRDNDDTFLSHLPISMDGSCNGLQNLSAMLMDEVGGAATNLVPSDTMNDIYQIVADKALTLLKDSKLSDKEARLRDMWVAHGIERKAVKRSVMTMPYGVTRNSATEYVVSDYLDRGHGPAFDPKERMVAAKVLMGAVWPAIGEVVVKGREAMQWLRKAGGILSKAIPDNEPAVVFWTTPTGFVAEQHYIDYDIVRVTSKLHGATNIRVAVENDGVDCKRHTSGMAPNFVHSMDASHLHLTTAKCSEVGIRSLAMIHDDYGTHAANSQRLFEVIRDQFAKMYTDHDPVQRFFDEHPGLPPPPDKGTLDINEVRNSQFFFS